MTDLFFDENFRQAFPVVSMLHFGIIADFYYQLDWKSFCKFQIFIDEGILLTEFT